MPDWLATAVPVGPNNISLTDRDVTRIPPAHAWSTIVPEC